MVIIIAITIIINITTTIGIIKIVLIICKDRWASLHKNMKTQGVWRARTLRKLAS